MFKKLLNSKTNNFTFAAFLIFLSSFLSGFLGLLRDRLLASNFGAGEILDIYFTAFRLPDFLQAILVGGGITVAFLPIFSQEFEKNKEKALKFGSNVLNVFLVCLIGVSLLLFFLAPFLMKFIAPGFNVSQRATTVILTRIMLLSPIIFGASAIFSGVLQYFERFFVFSLCPILYNIGIIFGILFFVPIFGIKGLAFGVIFGAILHVLIQVPVAKNSGFYYSKILDFKNPMLLKMFCLMAPSIIGSTFLQLNLIVMIALCSMLIPGSISIFTFAKNIQGLVSGLIGVPFAVSLFPILSKAWSSNLKEKFSDYFSSGIRQILFLVIPGSVLMFILRAQIVRIILGAGQWGWLETKLTAACLGIFSLAIFACSLIPLFEKTFYSLQDTKTPTKLRLIMVLVNIVLSILFLMILGPNHHFSNPLAHALNLKDVQDIRVLAFPLALVISSLLQSFLLFVILSKKIIVFEIVQIVAFLKKIILLSIITGGVVWIVLRPLAVIFPLNTFQNVFLQTLLAGICGLIVYIVGAAILKCPELKLLKESILKKSPDSITE